MTPTDAKGGRPVADQDKITRDDIEAKFRQLTGDVGDKAEAHTSEEELGVTTLTPRKQGDSK